MDEQVYKDLLSVASGQSFGLEEFRRVVADGPVSSEFSSIVADLCGQLRILTQIEQDISVIRSGEDTHGFVMDVTSFLQELECPYSKLVTAPLNERLVTQQDKLTLVNFLIGELQAARLNYAINGGEKSPEIHTSPVEASIRKISDVLGVSMSSSRDQKEFLSYLAAEMPKFLSKFPPDRLPTPLLSDPLTEDQWRQLEEINDDLSAEYRLRREMLLKRFDVTVQSFSWSDKAKSKEKELNEAYFPIRQQMSLDSKVSVADVMAATSDLLTVEKTCSGTLRQYTQCEINKTLMGNVPDRGGRPNEAVIPPREMPGFRPRQEGRGNYRGGGRGAGGRVQGGWAGNSGYGDHNRVGHYNHGGGFHGPREYRRGGGRREKEWL